MQRAGRTTHRASVRGEGPPVLARPPMLGGLGFGGFRKDLRRHAVVAVALAGGRRAVIEEMAMVPAAAFAVVFGARVDEVVVLLGVEDTRDGREEGGPAGPR